MDSDYQIPYFFPIKCLKDRSGYAVVSGGDYMPGICRKQGQVLRSGFRSVTCTDPNVICHEWDHRVMDSRWNNLPELTEADVKAIEAVETNSLEHTFGYEQNRATSEDKMNVGTILFFALIYGLFVVSLIAIKQHRNK